MYPFGERWGGGAVLRGDTLTLALALSQTGRGNGSGGVSQKSSCARIEIAASLRSSQ